MTVQAPKPALEERVRPYVEVWLRERRRNPAASVAAWCRMRDICDEYGMLLVNPAALAEKLGFDPDAGLDSG